MRQSRIIRLIALVLLFMIFGAVSFFVGDKYALEAMTVTRVTPDQLANAMKSDHFYSDYRESSLLVKGKVASIRKNGDFIVEFKTDSSFKTLCDFGSTSPAIRQGDTITAISEGAPAVRQPNAVELKSCVLP